jgi:hypothetical protein
VRAGVAIVVGARVADALATGALGAGALAAGAFAAGALAGVAFFIGALAAGRSFSPIGTIRSGGALDCANAAAPPTAMKPATQ